MKYIKLIIQGIIDFPTTSIAKDNYVTHILVNDVIEILWKMLANLTSHT